MAELIPDRLPSRASQGEKRLFAILQSMPDDIIVYYEPVVENRYPDFVIIHPRMGLMVIEVKGWYARDILAADNNTVLIRDHNGSSARMNHPVRQAREYVLGLMDRCRQSSQFQRLLNNDGKHQGRFIFPFGHFAILSNITRDQLVNHEQGDLTSVFPATRVVSRDEMIAWEEKDGEEIEQMIGSFFDPIWEIDPLQDSQIEALRAIIHPEIVLGAIPVLTPGESSEELSLKVLDTRQEQNARKIGEGHRIIYGVAGSGKTVLLISRVKLVAQNSPDSSILVLCYNVALAAYLRGALREFPTVSVMHFDAFSSRHGIKRKHGESDEELGRRLLDSLQVSQPAARQYDFVAIDEMQDFEPSWFQCVLETMKETNDGDLLIVGDGSQGLYRRIGVSWDSLGINAKGARTMYRRLDLDKNYRNSREIVRLAEAFATDDEEERDDATLAMRVNAESCVRTTGIAPVLIQCSSITDELVRCAATIKGLLDGKWMGREIEPLRPDQIAVLYPRLRRQSRNAFRNFIGHLEDLCPVLWVNDPEHRGNRERINEPKLKVQTIHSAKGLQYKAVNLIFAGDLPGTFEDTDVAAERRLLYVGLTRPEDYLALYFSDRSSFVTEMIESSVARVV